jgi:hypothetical protein
MSGSSSSRSSSSSENNSNNFDACERECRRNDRPTQHPAALRFSPSRWGRRSFLYLLNGSTYVLPPWARPGTGASPGRRRPTPSARGWPPPAAGPNPGPGSARRWRSVRRGAERGERKERVSGVCVCVCDDDDESHFPHKHDPGARTRNNTSAPAATTTTSNSAFRCRTQSAARASPPTARTSGPRGPGRPIPAPGCAGASGRRCRTPKRPSRTLR